MNAKTAVNPNVKPQVRPQRVIALSGPPAVGKSTFVQELQEAFTSAGLPAPPVVSPDYFIYEDGVYKWSPERAKKAWNLAYRKLERVSVFETDNPVVLWDSTLCNPKARKSLLQQWGHLTRPGSTRELVVLPNPSWETIYERNSERTPDRQVPVETMQRMYREWVDPRLGPVKEEGWTAIWFSTEKLIEDLRSNVIAPLLEAKKSQALEEIAAEISFSPDDFDPDAQFRRRR